MPYRINRKDSRGAIGLLVTALLVACGAQASASDGANVAALAKVRTANAAALAQRSPPAPVAASQTALPIEKGVYAASYAGGCSRANNLFFYDGNNFGSIWQATDGDGMNDPGSAGIDAYAIRRAGPQSRGSGDYKAELEGFTRIWTMDHEFGSAVRGVKSAGVGRFLFREGSASARRIEYGDETYQKCAPVQLSPRMQAAVFRFRPALAGIASPQAGSHATTPARPFFPPIEPGYWVHGTDCTSAILAAAELPSDQAGLYYFNEKGGWMGRFEIQQFLALGGKKYRMLGLDHSEIGSEPGGMDIAVNSRTSFTSVDEYADRYTHCPMSQIPRAIRADYEGR